MPTWGAASPTPGAARMVSIMSSASCTSLPSTSVISAARCLSTGSPNTRIEYRGTDPGYRLSQPLRVDLDPEAAGRARGGGQGVGERGGVGRSHQPAVVVGPQHVDLLPRQPLDERGGRL